MRSTITLVFAAIALAVGASAGPTDPCYPCNFEISGLGKLQKKHRLGRHYYAWYNTNGNDVTSSCQYKGGFCYYVNGKLQTGDKRVASGCTKGGDLTQNSTKRLCSRHSK